MNHTSLGQQRLWLFHQSFRALADAKDLAAAVSAPTSPAGTATVEIGG